MKLEDRQLQAIQLRSLSHPGFPPNDYIVWWYGAMRRNARARTLPLVVVWFRRMSQDGTLGEFFSREVGVTELGLLQIGTIWNDGVCSRQHALEERQFNVDFSTRGWRFASQSEGSNEHIGGLIPQDVYPLKYGRGDRSQLLIFQLSGGRQLLVPSLEFFSRCYGRSAYVNRVLTTYKWEEVTNRLLLPIDFPFPPDHWPVKLESRVYDDDAVFLAHVKHEPYAQHVAKLICGDLEAQFDSARNLAFPKIGPWFQERTKLIVQGVWLDTKRFLGLRVVGGKEPQEGPKVFWARENPGEAEKPAPEDAPETGWKGGSGQRPSTRPELVQLTAEEEPDHQGGTVEVRNPVFRIVGPRRAKERYQLKTAQTRPVTPERSESSDRYSSGDRSGSSRGTGVASIHTETVLEPKSAVRDVWDALCFLHRALPDLICGVGWFRPGTGTFDFKTKEPCMTTLLPVGPNGKQEALTDHQRWSYLDPKGTTPRGVLVMCVRTPSSTAYLFEVQRRKVMRKGENRIRYEKEEELCGLVASPSGAVQTHDWIFDVLKGIAAQKGVMARVTQYCPGSRVDYYKRSSSRGDQVSGHSTVISALSKVGIEVPRPKLTTNSQKK